jgi:heme-degrading monooxygenase HmoA
MHIKWIVCKVKDNFKKEFSIAQERWIETQNSIGFIGQVGGWDLNHNNTACIISFWENENSLNLFMKNIHDGLFYSSSQSEYYDSVNVTHFYSLLKMAGKFDSLTETLNYGKVLRIADCDVKKEKIEHFESVQKDIWIPGMKKSQGMLGGVFCKVKDNTSRYLVSTFWDSLQNHEKYLEQQLPKYINESDVNNDINKIIGRKILLVDSWNIIKKTTTNN